MQYQGYTANDDGAPHLQTVPTMGRSQVLLNRRKGRTGRGGRENAGRSSVGRGSPPAGLPKSVPPPPQPKVKAPQVQYDTDQAVTSILAEMPTATAMVAHRLPFVDDDGDDDFSTMSRPTSGLPPSKLNAALQSLSLSTRFRIPQHLIDTLYMDKDENLVQQQQQPDVLSVSTIAATTHASAGGDEHAYEGDHDESYQKGEESSVDTEYVLRTSKQLMRTPDSASAPSDSSRSGRCIRNAPTDSDVEQVEDMVRHLLASDTMEATVAGASRSSDELPLASSRSVAAVIADTHRSSSSSAQTAAALKARSMLPPTHRGLPPRPMVVLPSSSEPTSSTAAAVVAVHSDPGFSTDAAVATSGSIQTPPPPPTTIRKSPKPDKIQALREQHGDSVTTHEAKVPSETSLRTVASVGVQVTPPTSVGVQATPPPPAVVATSAPAPPPEPRPIVIVGVEVKPPPRPPNPAPGQPERPPQQQQQQHSKAPPSVRSFRSVSTAVSQSSIGCTSADTSMAPHSVASRSKASAYSQSTAMSTADDEEEDDSSGRSSAESSSHHDEQERLASQARIARAALALARQQERLDGASQASQSSAQTLPTRNSHAMPIVVDDEEEDEQEEEEDMDDWLESALKTGTLEEPATKDDGDDGNGEDEGLDDWLDNVIHLE